MLMVTVKDGDYVMLNENVKIRFVRAGSVNKLAIDAPKEVRITRQSVWEQQETAYPKSKKRYTPTQNREATKMVK